MAADRPQTGERLADDGVSERDRRLARQVRHGWRDAQPIAKVLSGFLHSEAGRRMRRFQKVTDVLAAELPANVVAKLRPVGISGGTLTIEAADGIILAELRQHRAARLQTALAKAGTGIDRIAWRLAATTRKR